jgi:hypothetical protein
MEGTNGSAQMMECFRPNKRRISISGPENMFLQRLSPSGNLCNRCEIIPWSSLAGEKIRNGSRGKLIIELSDTQDTHEELRNSDCRMCRCLSMIKPGHLDGTRCQLRAYSARHVFGRVRKKAWISELVDSVVIGVAPRGESVTACLSNGFFGIAGTNQQDYDFGPRMMSDVVDFELVNGWLRMCKEKHTKTRKDGIYCRRDDRSVPEGFQVVDCITGLTVPAPPGCTYVALS